MSFETEPTPTHTPGSALGSHLITEYYGCSPAILDDLALLEASLLEAARRAGTTPVKKEFHRFLPHGISGVVIIAESHLTIHTWPEHGYAAVDFFTCGASGELSHAHAYLHQALGAARSNQRLLQRGLDRPQPAGAEERGILWQAERHGPNELHAVRVASPIAAGGRDLWLADAQGGLLAGLRVSRVLHAGRTAYAQAEIVDTEYFGRLLVLDGLAQSSEFDEAAYHEALVVPAFVLSNRPLRRVAILGGGEGATLREVLRFPEVERCVMIDIDEELVDLCRAHLPTWSAGAFDDPRAEVRFEDAAQFLSRAAQQGQRFDLIIGDLPEAETGSPLGGLYGRATFDLIHSCLEPGGLYAGQLGSSLERTSTLGATEILGAAAQVFACITPYSRYISSFYAEWIFGIAVAIPQGQAAPFTPSALPADIVDERLLERRDPAWPCQTYDGQTHQRLFSLPKDLRAKLNRRPDSQTP